MHTYIAVLLGSLLLALLATPAVIRLAREVNVYDLPGVRKVHAASIPRLGGLAIVVPVLIAVLPVFVLPNVIGRDFRESSFHLLTLIGGSLLMFGVGLADDIWGLSAQTKLVAQTLVAGVLCLAGVSIDTVVIGEGHAFAFGWIGIPLTLLWVVGITNAVNLIDGLDGLAAGISLITCTVILVIAVYMDQPVMAVLMLAVIGSLAGFLVFNFNPARIFLGDSGSLFLGFLLAGSSVITSHKTTTLVALALPVLALGVPIFDTLFSVSRRLLERRSIFTPDAGHIHHRLLKRGIEHRTVVLVLYGVTAVACGLGLLVTMLHDAAQFVMLGVAFGFLLVVFRLSGVVSPRDILKRVTQNKAIAREARRHRIQFDHVSTMAQEALALDDWWSGLCAVAHALDFAFMSLRLAGTAVPAATWEGIGNGHGSQRTVVTYDLVNQRLQSIGSIEVVAHSDHSFESIGSRLAMFGRLLDEIPTSLFDAKAADGKVASRDVSLRRSRSRLARGAGR